MGRYVSFGIVSLTAFRSLFHLADLFLSSHFSQPLSNALMGVDAQYAVLKVVTVVVGSTAAQHGPARSVYSVLPRAAAERSCAKI